MLLPAPPSPSTNRRNTLVSFTGCVTDRYYCISDRLPPNKRRRISTSDQEITDISESLISQNIENYTLTLKLKSGLDVINIYLHLNNTSSIPIGLLPGTNITCYHFELKLSGTGNPYCIQSAISSINIINKDTSVTGQDWLSPVKLSTLIHKSMTKSLSLHNRVTVEGHIASVQYLSLRYFCNTCKVVLSDRSDCKLPNIVFEASLRYNNNNNNNNNNNVHVYCIAGNFGGEFLSFLIKIYQIKTCESSKI